MHFSRSRWLNGLTQRPFSDDDLAEWLTDFLAFAPVTIAVYAFIIGAFALGLLWLESRSRRRCI